MDEHRELEPRGDDSPPHGEGGMVLYKQTIALTSFVQTTVYREFQSFCEYCRRAKSIGVVYGVPGVGKTFAARAYTQWDIIESLLTHQGFMLPATSSLGLSLRGAFYTLGKTTRPKQLENDIALLQWSMQNLAKTLLQQEEDMQMESFLRNPWQLLFLDNVHFLDTYMLDVVQNLYDRYRIGVVLLGPPSVVGKHALSGHAHLKTRIGRYYAFRLLSKAEITPVLEDFVLFYKITVSSKPSEGLESLMAIIHKITAGNVSMLCLLLDKVLEVLQGEKEPQLSVAVLQKACDRLRW